MNSSRFEVAVIAAGLAYLAALSWSMANTSYDIWGALVVAPIYAALLTLSFRRMFRGDLVPVANAMSWGLALKCGGAMARYWVGFEAYDGGIDAQAYHEYASIAVDEFRAGNSSMFDILPSGTGTEFVERFTAFVYAISGGSQLAGFVTFSMLAYLGLAVFVKSATIAVPGLAARKYAWLCVLCPSLVYWPSSIGKDALMMLGLGVGTLGIAVMLTRRAWFSALLVATAGLGFAGLIRPHISAVWVAAVLPALVIAVVARFSGATRRSTSSIGLVLALGAATLGFAFAASTTLQFLVPDADDDSSTSDSITQIFEETSRRTAQAGSNFTPPSIDNPANWPYASLRTLTRPLPIEARGLTQLIPAAEMAALFGVYLLSWRRLRGLPRAVFTTPYVTFAVTVVLLGGLAYSSLANIAILARQKSLLFPFILLLPCLPVWQRHRSGAESETNERDWAGVAPAAVR